MKGFLLLVLIALPIAWGVMAFIQWDIGWLMKIGAWTNSERSGLIIVVLLSILYVGASITVWSK